jgi:hypothetical protein
MPIKVKVQLDCDHLREQLRELIGEIVKDVAENGPIITDCQHVCPQYSDQIAREIAELIIGKPIDDR